jgi:hypothetical protein
VLVAVRKDLHLAAGAASWSLAKVRVELVKQIFHFSVAGPWVRLRCWRCFSPRLFFFTPPGFFD